MGSRRVLPVVAAVVAAAVPTALAHGAAKPADRAAPAARTDWLPADKHGFGTSRTQASKVWFTLEGGELSETYYPRLDTPSFRDLQFVVTRGGHSQTERDSTVQRTTLVDPRSLTYRQVNTDRGHQWRLTKTYVTDPARSTVLLSVQFQSLAGRRYHVDVVAAPELSNGTTAEAATCSGGRLVTSDGQMASAIMARPSLRRASCTSTGPGGSLVEQARTALTGGHAHDSLTLALSFARDGGAAAQTAAESLAPGFATMSFRYASGWHRYLASLRPPPRSLATAAERRVYTVSELVLAASEDKTYRGAFVASPTMPWAWGTGLQTPSGPYHLVWSRDLYEIATALIADGDRPGAERALHFLFSRQQQADGSFPQNSDVSGRPVLTNLQLDEVADPIILAWQLGAHDPGTWQHVKRAADFISGWTDGQGHTAPYTPQERWENQAGYSPATIAAEIAGLVCAADLARRNGDIASAQHYLQTADAWRAHLNGWTLTSTGPYSHAPYYLRLTKDGDPNSGTTYSVGDSGPTLDQRAIVDPSFLELVRLGVVAARDPNIVNTIGVVDRQLSVSTPTGRFWHRYTGDGYGEQRNGQPWKTGFPPGSRATIGRLWPIFAGERGEYDLAAGTRGAPGELRAMAATANDGGFLPEQVWDDNPPAGGPGFPPGRPTFSATPLAWTHAQLIRLAWSISSGRPIETPAVVACRYVRKCRG